MNEMECGEKDDLDVLEGLLVVSYTEEGITTEREWRKEREREEREQSQTDGGE